MKKIQILLILYLVLLSSIIYGQSSSIDSCDCKTDKDVVFGGPEKLPYFPGGQEALLVYLRENIVYPQEATDSLYEDKVYIIFCIRKTGELTDIKVGRGQFKVLNKEALRVVTEMPNWEPAENRGQKICYLNMLPINFVLEKPTKRELRKAKRRRKKFR
jgi:hypothetical protein